MKKFILVICLVLAVLCLVTGCADDSAASQHQKEAADEGRTAAVESNASVDIDKNAVPDDNKINNKTNRNTKVVKSIKTSSDTAKTADDNNKSDSSVPVPKSTEKSILIKGSGVSEEIKVTLSQLQDMKSQVEEYIYFSRGKEPKTAYNTYKGVRLFDLISLAGLEEEAQKVFVVGTDGYTAAFSLSDVRAMLMDETDTSKSLPMLIAFAEDGKTLDYASGYSFRLIMGQKCEGDYNRQYWVRDVCSIVVK